MSAGAGLAPATVLVLGASPSSEALATALRAAAPALTVIPFAKDLDDATLATVEAAANRMSPGFLNSSMCVARPAKSATASLPIGSLPLPAY